PEDASPLVPPEDASPLVPPDEVPLAPVEPELEVLLVLSVEHATTRQAAVTPVSQRKLFIDAHLRRTMVTRQAPGSRKTASRSLEPGARSPEPLPTRTSRTRARGRATAPRGAS